MEHFTLQSPYFRLVELFLFFILFKIPMSAMSNPLKMPIIEIHESLPCFFINNAG